MDSNPWRFKSSPGHVFFELGCLAQLARAPRLHRGGRGFKSLSNHGKIQQPAKLAKVVTARV